MFSLFLKMDCYGSLVGERPQFHQDELDQEEMSCCCFFKAFNLDPESVLIMARWIKAKHLLHFIRILRNCAAQKKYSISHICNFKNSSHHVKKKEIKLILMKPIYFNMLSI